jgi:putative copper resistance protein D
MMMPDIWSLAAIITKFALYLGILTATGTVLAALMFRLNQFRGIALVFGGLAIIASLIGFSLKGANLTGDISGMLDLEMLGLLWSTPVGTAMALRLCGLGVLIVGLFMARGGLALSALGGITAVWSFGHIGHISDRGSAVLDVALTLHLITVAIWIGILTPLQRLARETATYAEAAKVGHRFGLVASFTVPALIIAGGYMSYTLVGSISLLIQTGYGQALIIKVLLVAVLLSLAAANKLRFMPRLRAGDATAANHLAKSISIEWLVVLLIFAITAVLTSNLTLPT